MRAPAIFTLCFLLNSAAFWAIQELIEAEGKICSKFKIFSFSVVVSFGKDKISHSVITEIITFF